MEWINENYNTNYEIGQIITFGNQKCKIVGVKNGRLRVLELSTKKNI